MIDANIYAQYLQSLPQQPKTQSLATLQHQLDIGRQRKMQEEQLAIQKQAQQLAMDKQRQELNNAAIAKSIMQPNGVSQAQTPQEKAMAVLPYSPTMATGLASLDKQFNPAPKQQIVGNQVVTLGQKPTATPISGITEDPFKNWTPEMKAQFAATQDPRAKQALVEVNKAKLEQKAAGATKIENYTGGEEGFKNEMDLRKEVNALPEIKEWTTIDSQVKRLDAAMAEANRGGNMVAVDQALITIFNKMLDPTSVVRESEYARTPGDLALVNRLKGSWDKITTGGAGLTAEDRAGIYNMAKKYGKVAESKYKQTKSFYSKIADKHGFDVNNIFSTNDDPLGLGI